MPSLRPTLYCAFMNRISHWGAPGIGTESVVQATSEQFHITVVWTTELGTRAALKTANSLARHTGLSVTLATIIVVPPAAPLDRPRDFINFLEQRAIRMLSSSDMDDQKFTVQTWFCRDQHKGLRQALGHPSLTVIGGRKKFWPTDEQKLEAWLQQQGYPIVFADTGAASFEILPLAQRQAVLHQLVKDFPAVPNGANRK